MEKVPSFVSRSLAEKVWCISQSLDVLLCLGLGVGEGMKGGGSLFITCVLSGEGMKGGGSRFLAGLGDG